MTIDYLIDNRENFKKFVSSIDSEDKIALISHIDLDGVASALFLEKIVETKNPSKIFHKFLSIKKDMLKEIYLELENLGITKIFISDLGVDLIDFEGFLELQDKFKVFLIDHHPPSKKVSNFDNIIKTSSQDCAAMTLFEIAKDFCDLSDFEWVNCAAIFSDFSYKKKENFEYLKSVYPQISLENISSSIPGINARKINSALAYYAEDIFYVFNLIKTRNLESLDQVHQIIEDEINSFIEDFSKNSKYFEEKNLYFYEIKSKFHLGSTVASLVSKMNPNKTFVFMQIIDGKVKFSARNQSGNQDVGKLMKDCVKDLDNASGGGHVMAAAAKIDLKDLTVFKKRLLE